MNIPFHKTYTTEDELNAVIESIKSGWLTMGPKTIEFEKKFNEYIGSKNSISMNSATAALHLALKAIGLQQNDEVIKRLDVILKSGNYESAKENLKAIGLESDKRSYTVLKPEGQSSTIMTIADDYIHYSNPRALTVREMARLQSFDDSFDFGK